jgi:hypothetical protein
MKSMMGDTYWENVRRSFIPEFISMNFMMAGMAPVMSFLMMGRDMRAMEPTEFLFWGVMSIGVIAGFILAYPSNVWMVARHLKHGLMTERKPERDVAREHPQLHLQLQAHAEEGHDHGHDHRRGRGPHQGRHGMKSDATMPQIAGLAVVSFLALLLGMLAPANWINMTLSAHDVGGDIMPPGTAIRPPRPCATWPRSIRGS